MHTHTTSNARSPGPIRPTSISWRCALQKFRIVAIEPLSVFPPRLIATWCDQFLNRQRHWEGRIWSTKWNSYELNACIICADSPTSCVIRRMPMYTERNPRNARGRILHPGDRLERLSELPFRTYAGLETACGCVLWASIGDDSDDPNDASRFQKTCCIVRRGIRILSLLSAAKRKTYSICLGRHAVQYLKIAVR